jgi:hypothetical protein
MWGLAYVHCYWKAVKGNLSILAFTEWFGKCISLSDLWFFMANTVLFMWFCLEIILFFVDNLQLSRYISRVQEKYLRLIFMIWTDKVKINSFRYFLLSFSYWLLLLLLWEKIWINCWRMIDLIIVSVFLS